MQRMKLLSVFYFFQKVLKGYSRVSSSWYTLLCVALKKRTRFLTSPEAGRLRSEVSMALIYCENSLPGLHTLNLCSFLEQTKLDFWHPFIRTLIPFRMMSPLWSNYLLKDSPPLISIPQNGFWARKVGIPHLLNTFSSYMLQYLYYVVQRETKNQ